VPLAGVKVTPPKLLLAVQLRVPGAEWGARLTVILQVQLPLAPTQLCPGLKAVGETANVGEQLHAGVTVLLLPPLCPTKVKVPVVQAPDGMEIVTLVVCPPDRRVPLAGAKLTPGRALLTDHVRTPLVPAASPTVAVQVQPLALLTGQFTPAAKLAGVTASIAGCGVQIHCTRTLLLRVPLKRKAP